MALKFNNHVFKGHKALLGNRYVTYGEVELSTRFDEFSKSKNGFDWGIHNNGSIQLAYSILTQISNSNIAQDFAEKFSIEIIKSLNARDWILSANDVIGWIRNNTAINVEEMQQKDIVSTFKNKEVLEKEKSNVVKDICNDLGITQKTLALILEIPEGTVSSWAVKNEIPRLGKKAIEFYKLNLKNQQIVNSYKNFINLLNN